MQHTQIYHPWQDRYGWPFEVASQRPAASRIKARMDRRKPQTESALPYLPEKRGLKALLGAARECRGCDLYRNATQTVFGSGRKGSPSLLSRSSLLTGWLTA